MEQAIIRYHIAHQLVSYGPANFNLDARINDVIAPSKKALYARVNPICANPIIEIQNTGSSDITSVEIQYYINEGDNIGDFCLGREFGLHGINNSSVTNWQRFLRIGN